MLYHVGKTYFLSECGEVFSDRLPSNKSVTEGIFICFLLEENVK
jgi:hypothetical protein